MYDPVRFNQIFGFVVGLHYYPKSLPNILTKMIHFSYLYYMETKIIHNHPSLKNTEERFKKILDSLVASFQIEGICFEDDVLKEMVERVEKEIKK